MGLHGGRRVVGWGWGWGLPLRGVCGEGGHLKFSGGRREGGGGSGGVGSVRIGPCAFDAQGV